VLTRPRRSPQFNRVTVLAILLIEDTPVLETARNKSYNPLAFVWPRGAPPPKMAAAGSHNYERVSHMAAAALLHILRLGRVTTPRFLPD
jgi:hypothetical protein